MTVTCVRKAFIGTLVSQVVVKGLGNPGPVLDDLVEADHRSVLKSDGAIEPELCQDHQVGLVLLRHLVQVQEQVDPDKLAFDVVEVEAEGKARSDFESLWLGLKGVASGRPLNLAAYG